MKLTLQQIEERLTALTEKAQEATSDLEAGHKTAEEVKAFMEETTPVITELKAEHAARLEEAEKAEMKSQLATLEDAIKQLATPQGIFVGGEGSGSTGDEDPYFVESGRKAATSIFADIRRANKGDSKALDRITSGFDNLNDEGHGRPCVGPEDRQSGR